MCDPGWRGRSAEVTGGLQPAFVFSLGFCSGLLSLTPAHGVCLPSSRHAHLWVSGGPGRPADLTEEVDLLPEGQADLLPAGQQPRLQRAAGCLRPQVSGPKGARVLRGLHPTAVSASGGQEAGCFPCSPPAPHCPSKALTSPLLPRNNVGLSAVCAYNLSTAEAVFSRGKYMQSATVEQSHTKWVRYNGAVPTPRPGAVSGPGLCGGLDMLATPCPPAIPGLGCCWRIRRPPSTGQYHGHAIPLPCSCRWVV